MSYFTFDTAWIVATMQNSNNEAIKAQIHERLDAMNCDFTPGYGGWESFETFCWAWRNDCIEPRRAPPVVDPWPYLDRIKGGQIDIIVHYGP